LKHGPDTEDLPQPAPSPWLVPFGDSFRVRKAATEPPRDAPGKEACQDRLARATLELDRLQRLLYADNRYALLAIFQAMDAAGKDGTIRAVMSGVDPSGCQVFAFKAPSPEELDHDFLWRTAVRLPERGRIGIFNRSYYEEVLVVRVHPRFLGAQRLPHNDPASIWEERFQSIRDHELHLARNGIVVVKFWLNVSRAEQKKRFLERIEEPEHNWKFSAADVREREYWDEYMNAYEEALRATARPWAPWYAIPADSKPFLRMCVAEILVDTLRRLDLRYPRVDGADRTRLDEMRQLLKAEKD
jgi:PPK2 family polyphosphate:nucleotide phosphotransferase